MTSWLRASGRVAATRPRQRPLIRMIKLPSWAKNVAQAQQEVRWRDDSEGGLPDQCQQITIATDQQARASGSGQFQEHRIVRIAAFRYRRYRGGHAHAGGEGQIVGQQFLSIVGGQAEL